MSKRDEPGKLRPVEIVIIVGACLFLLAVIMPASQTSRFDAYRIKCHKNLSEIGRAMLVYANDYDGEFPRSGGRESVWAAAIHDWKAANRFGAYSLSTNGTGGQANISSCFYLLVKYMDVAPKTFVCPGDVGTTEFKLDDVNAGDKKLIDLWDFGSEAGKHCSYAYQMPFCLYALTTSSHPDAPVAADRNPWMNSPTESAKQFPGFFNPDGGKESVKYGNANAHKEKGQNVLFVDGHVSFEKKASCGINNDNIYTFWDGGDLRIGTPPFSIRTVPQGRIDSLLVHDPAPPRGTAIIKKAETINSANLEQTSVVTTLNCSMLEHKNVIWCSTFQMTWDKLKNDMIGESVKVPQAAELASRLNQAEFSPENLEAESFYAIVGIVKDGIIEKIQKEMKKHFPSESVPLFNELDVLPPLLQAETIVSYSFLKTDIRFRYPFYTREDAFSFTDSNGTITKVRSFCTNLETYSSNSAREQVDVLYYMQGDQINEPEFAVDLCTYTNPYQVVLACVPKQKNLGKTVAFVERKISEFKQDPDYMQLQKLQPVSGIRPADSLIVPDMLYKLTHHIAELEGKGLGNNGWKSYFFLEAIQVIDFALSQTGVALKSEARIIIPPAERIPEPRHFYFNRPFLIYVKKRGPDYSPFFVMWVDNAELMEKF